MNKLFPLLFILIPIFIYAHPNNFHNNSSDFISFEAPLNTNKVHPFYLITSDYVFNQTEQDSIMDLMHEIQAWYQVATGGLTFELKDPTSPTVVQLPNSSDYYVVDRWTRIINDMQSLGYTPFEISEVKIFFIKGGGGMALGQRSCNFECGLAMIGLDVWDEFNTGQDYADCPDAPGGVGAWPCIPAATAAHEIGHAFGLRHPVNVPETQDVATHSLMQTHWHYPYNWAPPGDSPWGLLTLERQQLEASVFFSTDVQLEQPFPNFPIVNLPDLGDAPTASFSYNIDGNSVSFQNTSTGATLYYWTFGDNQVSNSVNPIHTYSEEGSYTIHLRASAPNNMIDTFKTTIHIQNSELTLSCSEDITVFVPQGQNAPVNWDEPIASSNCASGNACPTAPISGFNFLGEFNNSQYYLSDQSLNWEEANLVSQAIEGGQLAIINSEEENAFLASNISNGDALFIGLSDASQEGIYQWTNGSPLSYSNWENGQPSNDSPEVDYVAIHGWSDGKWADYHFWTQKKFILEIECGESNNIIITQTEGASNGSLFSVGTTVISYSASDDCSNSAQCSFTITLQETNVDCEGIAGGNTLPGTPCDDGNPNTIDDTYNENCDCIGTPLSGGNLLLNCPDNITVSITEGSNGSIVNWAEPDAQSDCELMTPTNSCSTSYISGFSLLGEFNNSQYYLSDQPLNWEHAQLICETHGGHLAIINNLEENTFISNNLGSSTSVFIGLSDQLDEGTYQWVNGESVNYTNWENGQPSNHSPEVDYVALHGWSNGQWADYHFWTQKKYLMEISCDSGNSITITQTNGLPNASFFPLGIHSIAYMAVDNCGNEASCSFDVIVEQESMPCSNLENYAFQKPATQSSTRFNADADRAVNGNTNGNFWQDFSVSHTEWESNAWWEVDLGKNQLIEEIKLWNRTDCCSEHLTDYYIFVSPEPFNSTDLSLTLEQMGVWYSLQSEIAGSPSTIPLAQSGRYVRIQLVNQSFLALTEVEILGCPTTSQNVLALDAEFDHKMDAKLYWINNKTEKDALFILEKSTDGNQFQELSQINSHPDKGYHTESYLYHDNNLFEGRNYYRIKQLFNDGHFEYSNIAMLEFLPGSAFTIFPNPAKNEINIYLKQFMNREIDIVIYDRFTRPISKHHSTNIKDPIFQIDISSQNLFNGLYFVSIIEKGKAYTTKLVINNLK